MEQSPDENAAENQQHSLNNIKSQELVKFLYLAFLEQDPLSLKTKVVFELGTNESFVRG